MFAVLEASLLWQELPEGESPTSTEQQGLLELGTSDLQLFCPLLLSLKGDPVQVGWMAQMTTLTAA